MNPITSDNDICCFSCSIGKMQNILSLVVVILLYCQEAFVCFQHLMREIRPQNIEQVGSVYASVRLLREFYDGQFFSCLVVPEPSAISSTIDCTMFIGNVQQSLLQAVSIEAAERVLGERNTRSYFSKFLCLFLHSDIT